MKLSVFGASSPTGKLVVAQALSNGHQVTAFVRNEAKLGIQNPNLKVISGDALNPIHVENTVKGNGAVISTLGPKGKPAVVAAQSTKNIIEAMEKHGLKRLIVVSVAGIPVMQDHRKRNFVDRLLKWVLKDVFIDRENQLAILQSSNLEWVAVRVPRLTDGPAKGSVKAFFGSPSPRFNITRADLANFMLQQLTSDEWVRRAPIVSNSQ